MNNSTIPCLRALTAVGLAVVLMVAMAAQPLQALPVPSMTEAEQTLVERAEILASLGTVLDQQEVIDVLAEHGLTRDEVNQRLAQLSAEELQELSSQIDHLEAAGQWAPGWIWILVAVLIIVAIVAIAS
jgi:hypothetical protein